MLLKITRLTHGSIITTKNEKCVRVVTSFINQLKEIEKKWNPKTSRFDETFLGERGTMSMAIDSSGNSRFGVLSTDHDDLVAYINKQGIPASEIAYEDKRHSTKGLPFDFKMFAHWQPRNEAQQQAVDFILQPNTSTRVISADTGFGKTFTAFYSAMNYGRRTALIMEPVHVETWIKSIKEYSGLSDERICVIQGSPMLHAAIDMAIKGIFDYDFVCISAPTLREFIKSFESYEGYDAAIKPWDLMELFGIGLVVRDEAHEAIFAVVKQTIYCNVSKIIYLSATLVEDTDVRKRVYPKIFPRADTWTSPVNKHIHTIPLRYKSSLLKPIRYKGPKGYSHIKFEQDILKRPKLKKSYYDLIGLVVEQGHMKVRQEDGKILIFCSLVDMCKDLAEHFKTKYPDMKVNYFVSGTPYKTLAESDIIVSTPKSCGTGRDIAQLETVLQTVAIGSEGLSRQICGRLRPYYEKDGTKRPDVMPRYYFLTNVDIPPHMVYDRQRMLYMAKRSAKMSPANLTFRLTDR